MSPASLIVTSNIQTRLPAEEVWKVMSDYKRWTSWDNELKDVHMNEGMLSEDGEGDMWDNKRSHAHFRITRVQPDFTYTLETRLPFAQVYTRRILGYHNSKTIITHEVWIEGPLRGLWGTLLGKRYERRMRELNESLAAVLEKSGIGELAN